jgi:hypothetical protein
LKYSLQDVLLPGHLKEMQTSSNVPFNITKLNLGRLQWIYLNNSEICLIYGTSEFRGKCLFKSWTRRILKVVGLSEQHWKLQKMDFWKSGIPFLKFWLSESVAMAALSVRCSAHPCDSLC